MNVSIRFVPLDLKDFPDARSSGRRIRSKFKAGWTLCNTVELLRAQLSKWESSFNNMGAAFQATVDELHTICVAVLGKDPDSSDEYDMALSEAAAIRAENAQLKGLIEGMRFHEHSCGANYHVGSKRGPDPCTCIKSKVNA
jgi:hypothetical protein